MTDQRCLKLEGLAGHLSLAELGSTASRKMLQVEDSPRLDTLDLSGHPGPLELLLGPAVRPELVLLPKCGAFLHLRLADGALPDLCVLGPVRGCLIERGCDAAGPDRYEAYVLKESMGLVVQSGDAVHPFPGIGRHVRIDQSGRGLQLKDLRRGVDHRSVLWRLEVMATPVSCPAARLLWLAGSPGMLESAVFRADRPGTDGFADWAANLAVPPPLNQPNLLGRLPIDALALLARLARFGEALAALWILRCGVQMARLGIEPPERPQAMIEAATPDWSDDSTLRSRRSGWPDADLDLFAACCHLRETKPFAKRLVEVEHPSQLRSLIEAASRQPAGARARAVIMQCAIRGMDSLRRKAAADRRRDPRWHGDEWLLPGHEAAVLESMPNKLVELGNRTLIDHFIVLAEEVLPVNKFLECGIVLHQHGWPQGRRVVARCLGGDHRLTARARRRAMECLLSPISGANRSSGGPRIEFREEEYLA